MGLRLQGVSRLSNFSREDSILPGYVDPRSVEIDYVDDLVFSDELTIDGSTPPSSPNIAQVQPQNPIPQTVAPIPGPTEQTERFASGVKTTTDSVLTDSERVGYRGAAAALRASGGVVNAISKYQQTVDRNTFNIQMAEIQTLQVVSETQRDILREQTKGKARSGQALISSIAQGQGVTSDYTQRAINAEDVYTAQNMMMLEINGARAAYNLEQQQIALRSENRTAAINRDLEIMNSIVSAGAGFMGSI